MLATSGQSVEVGLGPGMPASGALELTNTTSTVTTTCILSHLDRLCELLTRFEAIALENLSAKNNSEDMPRKPVNKLKYIT